MKKDSLYLFLIIIALLLIVILMSRSSFGEVMNKSYSCEKDNRLYPSGKISGDYLNLNKPERDKLMVNFIKNGNE
jgi:hypothetical protein